MKFYDVSLPIFDNMILWPGSIKTKVELVKSIENGDTSNVSSIKISVHSGTHIDAPFHSIKNGKGVDCIQADLLIGKVSVFELKNVTDSIKEEDLKKLNLNKVERILFKTRNSIYLRKREIQKKFIYISDSAAVYMIEKKIKLVGIDYFSIELHENIEKTAHRILLSNNIVIIEGLDLFRVEEGEYNLIAMPLKIKDADAAPSRVFLLKN